MVARWFDQGRCGEFDDLEAESLIASSDRYSFMETPTPTTTSVESSRRLTKSPARILLAEDDADMRGLLTRSLTHEGYDVTECTNGIQLLDRLSGLLHIQPLEPFDLIVSDIRMPGLNGLEILKGLQGRSDVPPTILITAFGDDATHASALLAGAVVTLDKPFEVEELLTAVSKVLANGDRK